MSAPASILLHNPPAPTRILIRNLRPRGGSAPSLSVHHGYSPCLTWSWRRYVFSSMRTQHAASRPGTKTTVRESMPLAGSKHKKNPAGISSRPSPNRNKLKDMRLQPIRHVSHSDNKSKLEFKSQSIEDHAKSNSRATPSKRKVAKAQTSNKNSDNSSGKSNFHHRNLKLEQKKSARRKHKKKIHAKWDPYVLAEKTKKALDKGQVTEAVALARDGGDRSTVSWNYIIQHEFQHKHVSAALRYFTEMRKRGAAPNDRTFTMVLNGLAINVDIAPTAVQKCLRVFAYITDQKRVKVNNFHLNVALKVCVAASDVDAMWQVLDMADNIVEPDEATYTTIAPLLAKEGISLEDVFPKEINSERQVGFIPLSKDSPTSDGRPGNEIARQSRSRRTNRLKESRQSLTSEAAAA
ncbi:hypothetical protein V1525DRAFT_371261 [Lipomyces kononenkoae]|uniref:Uncharacterized protein n=1 Tax=Lipomyces kononenkoae TaxID=34357 RepID=A0ACC3T976_LIPKO